MAFFLDVFGVVASHLHGRQSLPKLFHFNLIVGLGDLGNHVGLALAGKQCLDKIHEI